MNGLRKTRSTLRITIKSTLLYIEMLFIAKTTKDAILSTIDRILLILCILLFN